MVEFTIEVLHESKVLIERPEGTILYVVMHQLLT